MSKDAETLIGHILDSIHLIQEYTNQLSLDDFLADTQVQDAVIRRIEIAERCYRENQMKAYG
jgi:uncharacterized protein with HEPN domain